MIKISIQNIKFKEIFYYILKLKINVILNFGTVLISGNFIPFSIKHSENK